MSIYNPTPLSSERCYGRPELCLSSSENSDVEYEIPEALKLEDAIRDIVGWEDLENANSVLNYPIHQYS